MAPADAPATDPETVLADLELRRGLAIQMTTVAALGFVVALAAFRWLYVAATGGPVTLQFAPDGVGWWNGALDLFVVVVLVTAVVGPHEWIHGLAIRHYGGTAKYGVGVAHFVLPYAYATTDHRFTRDQFLVVLLAPLVVLTAVGVPIMVLLEWDWLILPLAANAGGAVGDVWMALTLLGYPPHVSVEDRESGIRMLGRATDRPREPSVGTVVWDALAGTAVASVGVVLLVGSHRSSCRPSASNRSRSGRPGRSSTCSRSPPVPAGSR